MLFNPLLQVGNISSFLLCLWTYDIYIIIDT